MDFFRFFFLPSENMTRWLLSEARRDGVLAPVVDDLESFGFEMVHSFWEGNGQYNPVMLGGADIETEFLKLHAAGEIKAKFHIGYRHGAGAALFYFLHELVHFRQDMQGRLLTENIIELECEAAVESICAAYRLRHAGYPTAWRGAMGSINARSLAKAYTLHQDPARLRAEWLQSSQKRFYARKITPTNKEGTSPVYLWKKLRKQEV